MTAINEYRTQIEEIQKRLDGSDDQNDGQIGELKERLNAVRSSLLSKQETIENQRREIECLRDENDQLSEMLGQALTALNKQSKSNLREIVQNFDSEISVLLHDGEADAAVVVETGPDENPQDGKSDGGSDAAADTQAEAEARADPEQPDNDGGRRAQPSDDADQQEPPSKDGAPVWDPRNESPMLKRIMGRKRG